MATADLNHYTALLSQIDVGWYHYKLLLKCALCIASDGIEIVSISFVITNLEPDLHLSNNDKGILTAMIFIGMITGGLIGGTVADHPKISRKKVLQYSMLINGAFGALSSICNNLQLLLLMRFFSGTGVGASISTLWGYVSEFFDPNNRSKHLSILSTSFNIGAAVTAVIAWLVFTRACGCRDSQPHSDNINFTIFNNTIDIDIAKWKIFVIVCAIPCLIGFVVFGWFADNSPKFLLFVRKDYVTAGKVLAKMAKQNNVEIDPIMVEPNRLQILCAAGNYDIDDDNSDNDAVGTNIDSEHINSHNENKEESLTTAMIENTTTSTSTSLCAKVHKEIKRIVSKLLYLFTDSQLRRSHILGVIVWFCLSFGYTGLLEWLPSYLDTINNVNVYFTGVVTQCSQIPTVLISSFLIDPKNSVELFKWFDQRKILAISLFCGGASLIGLLFIKTGYHVVLLLCIFNAVMEPGWSALNVISTELSPTWVRTTAFAVFTAFGRFGAIMGNLTFGFFGHDDFGIPLMTGGVCLFIGSICVLLLPNMKGKEVM